MEDVLIKIFSPKVLWALLASTMGERALSAHLPPPFMYMSKFKGAVSLVAFSNRRTGYHGRCTHVFGCIVLSINYHDVNLVFQKYKVKYLNQHAICTSWRLLFVSSTSERNVKYTYNILIVFLEGKKNLAMTFERRHFRKFTFFITDFTSLSSGKKREWVDGALLLMHDLSHTKFTQLCRLAFLSDHFLSGCGKHFLITSLYCNEMLRSYFFGNSIFRSLIWTRLFVWVYWVFCFIDTVPDVS